MQPFVKAPTYWMDEGEYRGLPRATRYIYLELSKCGRALGSGSIVLTAGASDVDGVRDLIGGNVREIARALADLQRPIVGGAVAGPPPLTIEGPRERRVLTITHFDEEQRVDTSAKRTRDWREKRRQSSPPPPPGDVTRDAPPRHGDGHGDGHTVSPGDGSIVTVTLSEREREREREENPPPPTGGDGASGEHDDAGEPPALPDDEPPGAPVDDRPSGARPVARAVSVGGPPSPDRLPREKSLRRLEGSLLQAAYARGVSRATGAPYAFPAEQARELDDAVDTHAPSLRIDATEPWVEASAHDFARARYGDADGMRFRHGLEPKGFRDWLNAPRAPLARTGKPPIQAYSPAPPDAKPRVVFEGNDDFSAEAAEFLRAMEARS